MRLDIETRRCDHAVAFDMQPPVALVSVLQPRYIPAFPRVDSRRAHLSNLAGSSNNAWPRDQTAWRTRRDLAER